VLPKVACPQRRLPIIGEALAVHEPTTGTLPASCAGLLMVAVGIAWAIVRDVPMKANAA
jgi:hypothetical protein